MPLLTGRYWEMVERLKLDHIYLAPTSLRLLLKAGDSWVKKYDLSSQRKLGFGKRQTYMHTFLLACFDSWVKKYDLSSLRKLGYGERQTYMHTHFCLLVLNHG